MRQKREIEVFKLVIWKLIIEKFIFRIFYRFTLFVLDIKPNFAVLLSIISYEEFNGLLFLYKMCCILSGAG